MIVLVVSGAQPIHVAAFTAASLAILFGALTMQEAYRAIEWKAIFLVAAVLPDIDLVYFYLIDNRQTLHHEYWTHIPIFWAAVAAVVAGLFRLARAPIPTAAFAIIFANIFLHLVLDTMAGGIAWAYPWDQTSFVAVTVPARFDWWVWNFVLHWSFLAELAILGWAARDIGVAPVLRGLWRALRARMLARKPGPASGDP